MSTQVTLTLPDETYRRAENLAQLTGRPLTDVLSDTLQISLPTLGTPDAAMPIQDLPDADLLILADSHMPPDQDRRYRQLLDDQQAGSLTEASRAELTLLLQLYQEGLLRKAQVLREAVRRGLRAPLEP